MQFPNLNYDLNEGATMLAMFIPSIVGDCLDRSDLNVGIVLAHFSVRSWIHEHILAEAHRHGDNPEFMYDYVRFNNGSTILLRAISDGVFRGWSLNQLYIPRPDGLDRKKQKTLQESVIEGLWPVIATACKGEMITY